MPQNNDKAHQADEIQLKHDFFNRTPVKEWTLINGVRYYKEQNIPLPQTYGLLANALENIEKKRKNLPKRGQVLKQELKAMKELQEGASPAPQPVLPQSITKLADKIDNFANLSQNNYTGSTHINHLNSSEKSIDENYASSSSPTPSHSNKNKFTFKGSVSNYSSIKSPDTTVASSQVAQTGTSIKRSTETAGAPNSKKPKTIESSKSKSSIGDKIWTIWEEFLHDASHDDTLFIYSPIRSGVITCGDGIPPQPNMPKQKYYKLLEELKNKNADYISFPFHKYIDDVLDSKTLDDMMLAARSLPDIDEARTISPGHSLKMLFFLQDVFLVFSRDVYDRRTSLAHSESMYNTMLIFPTLKAMVMASNDVNIRYVPGEEPLHSMTLYLRSTIPQYNDRYCYKADGIIKYNADSSFEAEILLLETSNGYGVADATKTGFDHHKSMFGLLSMLKNIADEYSYCSFPTFSKLELYFLHAYRDKMRLWSLSSPSKGIYVLDKKWTMTVPVYFEKKDPELLVYLIKFWDLKVKLEQSTHTIMSIKDEHKMTLKEYRYKEYPSTQLLSTIVDPAITKITENEDSKGMGKQFPRSSLDSSNNPK